MPPRWLLSSLLCATMLAQAAVQEPDAAATAAAVRAAMLLKIAGYLEVEPPKSGEQPTTTKQYRIGVVGNDATVAVAQKTLPGKSVGTAKVEVVSITTDDAIAGRAAAQCDLLYVATGLDAETVEKIVAQQAKQPVALVSAQPGFAAAGGGVQLFVKDGGTRLEVNKEALRRQGLRVSAQLLKHSQKGPTR